MPKFHVTYDQCTPESAEHGDYSESGFLLPGGWHIELEPGVFGTEAGKIKADCGLSLGEAIRLVDGHLEKNHGDTSFYEAEFNTIDYRTGTEERLALHCPDNITASSLGRIERLLVNRGQLR